MCSQFSGVDSGYSCCCTEGERIIEDVIERKAGKKRQAEETKDGEWWGQRTWAMNNTKKPVNDNGRRESNFSCSLSLSLWKVIYNTSPFQPSRVGDNWPGSREVRYFKLPLFQIRWWSTTLSVPQCAGTEARWRRAVKAEQKGISAQDGWRYRAHHEMETWEYGVVKGRREAMRTESLFWETGKLHTDRTYCHSKVDTCTHKFI